MQHEFLKEPKEFASFPKPKLSIGQQVRVGYDKTDDIYTIKGIYLTEGPVQYYLSNFKTSGYVLETDLTLNSPDGQGAN